jgi:hypothetical protein
LLRLRALRKYGDAKDSTMASATTAISAPNHSCRVMDFIGFKNFGCAYLFGFPMT